MTSSIELIVWPWLHGDVLIQENSKWGIIPGIIQFGFGASGRGTASPYDGRGFEPTAIRGFFSLFRLIQATFSGLHQHFNVP